jgi:hypothetical protein
LIEIEVTVSLEDGGERRIFNITPPQADQS